MREDPEESPSATPADAEPPADDQGLQGSPEKTLSRLQRRALVFALVLATPFVLRGAWHSLAILTLTVAVAIVQLRWLASHVAGLTALALDFSAAEEVSPAAGLGAAEHPESRGLSEESSSANPESDETPRRLRRRAILAALGRLPVLIGLVTVLVVFGGSHPWAIAAGLLTVPLALMTEAFCAARAN